MKIDEMIKTFYKALWKKPIKKWVKITIMVIAIAIITWLSTNCATQYTHRCAALSNNDTIEIIHEYRGNVQK